MNSLLDTEIVIGDHRRQVADFLEYSQTDVFLWWRNGKLLANYTARHANRDKPHLVFSVSKSVTGILAGILHDRGIIDPAQTVDHYLPQTARSGFGDCPLQHLLDMRVSIDFTEEYLNQDGDYARYRRATLWNPPVPGKPVETLLEFLCSVGKGNGPHGEAFRYLSPVSDLIGIILEAVTGTRYCDLLSDLLWQPMEAASRAMMTVDAIGSPRAAGGLSIAADDLLTIGRLLLQDGSLNGRQIVSERWVGDMRSRGDEKAWANGNFCNFIPGGRYRNQWYQMPRGHDAFLAVGIHGQWLYVDRAKGAIFVKLSSQPVPQNDALDGECLAFFKALSEIGV